ncbi:MAG TPA: SRPBCC family protein [Chloroflexia bacterium]|nr:SRPBCC family protein [Chloroflexia bacterium]
MAADPAVIFKLAAEIERWPLFLPHYRYVRLLRVAPDRRFKVAAMGARRDFLPVSWTTTQELFPDENPRRIRFRHVRGITRGMDVAWLITPGPHTTHVAIQHYFAPGWPLIGGWPTERIIGAFFVGTIAGRTLRCVKATAEAAMVALERS